MRATSSVRSTNRGPRNDHCRHSHMGMVERQLQEALFAGTGCPRDVFRDLPLCHQLLGDRHAGRSRPPALRSRRSLVAETVACGTAGPAAPTRSRHRSRIFPVELVPQRSSGPDHRRFGTRASCANHHKRQAHPFVSGRAEPLVTDRILHHGGDGSALGILLRIRAIRARQRRDLHRALSGLTPAPSCRWPRRSAAGEALPEWLRF